MLNLRADVQILPLSIEHAQKTLTWVKEPNVRQNLGIKDSPSLEKTLEWIKRANESTEILAFGIFLTEVHIGNVVLDKLDENLSAARFSIYIGERDLRSVGVGRTATYLICQYGFEKLSLNKIWLTVHTRNFRAINTYSQVGFKLEGILREEFLLNDERIDVLYMGLIKKEFEEQTIYFT